MPRCRLGFDEETKLRLKADYAERGRGPIRQENCQCGRLVVAESIGGVWLPRPHYPPSLYKSGKRMNPSGDTGGKSSGGK